MYKVVMKYIIPGTSITKEVSSTATEETLPRILVKFASRIVSNKCNNVNLQSLLITECSESEAQTIDQQIKDRLIETLQHYPSVIRVIRVGGKFDEKDVKSEIYLESRVYDSDLYSLQKIVEELYEVEINQSTKVMLTYPKKDEEPTIPEETVSEVLRKGVDF